MLQLMIKRLKNWITVSTRLDNVVFQLWQISISYILQFNAFLEWMDASSGFYALQFLCVCVYIYSLVLQTSLVN